MMLLPGPVEVPEAVLRDSAYVQNHRSQEFREIVKESSEKLDSLADASQSLITTGSGTTAVESVVYSMVSPGEDVLALTFGEFGNRMVESLKRRGAVPTVISKSHTDSLDLTELDDAVKKNAKLKTLFLVHNETGNGTSLHRLKEISQWGKASGMKVLVDSVSGFGSTEIRANSWGIDAFATCSQKGLASVPGLGIVCLSEEGSKYVLDSGNMPSYLDLNTSIKFMSKSETPYTPSTGSFKALLTALKILENEGKERRWERHHQSALFVRGQLKKNGLEIYGNESNYSDTVVAFRPPVPAPELIKKLSEKNIVVAKGIHGDSETMVRVGLLGNVPHTSIAAFLNEVYKILQIDEVVDPEKMPLGTKVNPGIFEL